MKCSAAEVVILRGVNFNSQNLPSARLPLLWRWESSCPTSPHMSSSSSDEEIFCSSYSASSSSPLSPDELLKVLRLMCSCWMEAGQGFLSIGCLAGLSYSTFLRHGMGMRAWEREGAMYILQKLLWTVCQTWAGDEWELRPMVTISDIYCIVKGASIYDVRTEGGGGLAQKKML